MERDTYPRRWGLGPKAQIKKKLVAEGKLGKFGKKIEVTPEEWLRALPELKYFIFFFTLFLHSF